MGFSFFLRLGVLEGYLRSGKAKSFLFTASSFAYNHSSSVGGLLGVSEPNNDHLYLAFKYSTCLRALARTQIPHWKSVDFYDKASLQLLMTPYILGSPRCHRVYENMSSQGYSGSRL